MLFDHIYPYTNFHELNLEWLLSQFKELQKFVKDFALTNEITYGGEWDISKGYQASTIVVYNDSGYIAIKPVPVGVDITNNDYWVKVANFTQEIAGIGSRVDALEDDVSDLEETVAAIPEYIAAKRNKNIVFFGDSWTVGTGATDEASAFPALTAAALDMTPFNFGTGAAGFTRPNAIISQITGNSMTAAERLNTSVVVITGGVNDIRYASETNLTLLSNNIINAARLASNMFKNAIIVMAVLTTVQHGISDTYKYWMGYCIDRLMSASIERVIVADMRYILYNRVNAYISDGFHPNDFGHGLVSGQIVNAVLGSKSECYHYIETGLVFDSSVADAPSGGHIFFNNGILNVTECRLNFVNAITDRTLVGTVNAAVIPNNNVYTPFYYGDNAVGTFAITSNGNVYIIPESGQSLTTGFIQPFSYTA